MTAARDASCQYANASSGCPMTAAERKNHLWNFLRKARDAWTPSSTIAILRRCEASGPQPRRAPRRR